MLDTYFQRVIERQNASRVAHRRTLFSIFHNSNAMKLSWVGIKEDRGEKVIAWNDVIRVEAFKRDLYAVDLICLKIHFDHNNSVELDEEMDGWESLLERLPEYLPGSQKLSEWFEVVAFPPFKPKLTVIYRRTNITSYCRVEFQP